MFSHVSQLFLIRCFTSSFCCKYNSSHSPFSSSLVYFFSIYFLISLNSHVIQTGSQILTFLFVLLLNVLCEDSSVQWHAPHHHRVIFLYPPIVLLGLPPLSSNFLTNSLISWSFLTCKYFTSSVFSLLHSIVLLNIFTSTYI